MKRPILEISAILLATTFTGGMQAATEAKKENRARSNQAKQQQPAEQTPPKLTDENIQAAVEKKLKNLDGIDTSELQIKTNDRTVTVTGTVDSMIETDRIMEAVSATRGVEGVITNFTVEAEPRSNREVKADVIAALQFDPVTSDDSINVVVNNGEVRLTGKAETSAEKQLAGWIAANVPRAGTPSRVRMRS